MRREQALLHLASSTAEAAGSVLANLAPGQVERGTPSLVPQGQSPFQEITYPAVACSVRYVDGVAGTTVFVFSLLGARRLAALVRGSAPPASTQGELTEPELAAVSEAMSQMMSAAAAEAAKVLGHAIEIGPPDTRVLERSTQAEELFELTPWAATVSFTFAGEPGCLVQLVPNAFVVRMAKALDELGAMASGIEGGEGGLPSQALCHLSVRLSAELGRARLPVGHVGALAGRVVELDRAADDPIDVLVNGHPFARGRLVVADGEWAIRIEELALPLEALTSPRGKE